jgi:glycosyltransferase involved in cell wall biosynthesis
MVPRLSGVGGMVSFQEKLSAGLARRGIEVCYDLSDRPYRSVLVVGGTRQLAGLWRARRRGARIVQRLDGMNWMQRVTRTGIRHRLRAEYGNLLLAYIRGRLADRVVYQSEFSRDWWERARGKTGVPFEVIHNGVDLAVFTPEGRGERPDDRACILLVEGSLMGGYEFGLANALDLALGLAARSTGAPGGTRKVELRVAGRVTPAEKDAWERRLADQNQAGRVSLAWAGLVPHDCIPELDRSAHLLFSGDLNPACPNSVIEALACGAPVVAFATGALPELVSGEAGRVVPYGGDPWRLDRPDLPSLVEGAMEVLADQPRFRQGARRRAEEMFALDRMVDRYAHVLLGEPESLEL